MCILTFAHTTLGRVDCCSNSEKFISAARSFKQKRNFFGFGSEYRLIVHGPPVTWAETTI